LLLFSGLIFIVFLFFFWADADVEVLAEVAAPLLGESSALVNHLIHDQVAALGPIPRLRLPPLTVSHLFRRLGDGRAALDAILPRLARDHTRTVFVYLL
jgi:hypothetical protein